MHPLDGLATTDGLNPRDPRHCVLSLGGFAYLDAAHRCVCINGLTPDGTGLAFSDGHALARAPLPAPVQGRLRPVVAPELVALGALRAAWLCPGEDLPGMLVHNMFGGFLFQTVDAPDDLVFFAVSAADRAFFALPQPLDPLGPRAAPALAPVPAPPLIQEPGRGGSTVARLSPGLGRQRSTDFPLIPTLPTGEKEPPGGGPAASEGAPPPPVAETGAVFTFKPYRQGHSSLAPHPRSRSSVSAAGPGSDARGRARALWRLVRQHVKALGGSRRAIGWRLDMSLEDGGFHAPLRGLFNDCDAVLPLAEALQPVMHLIRGVEEVRCAGGRAPLPPRARGWGWILGGGVGGSTSRGARAARRFSRLARPSTRSPAGSPAGQAED